MSEYEPEYAEGEILVSFRIEAGEGFARDLGQTLDYDLKGRDGRWEYGDAVVYEVPAGEEDEACEKFEDREDFVDWAARRDVRLEKRWEGVEEAEEMLDEIDFKAGSDECKEKLDELISFLEELKDR